MDIQYTELCIDGYTVHRAMYRWIYTVHRAMYNMLKKLIQDNYLESALYGFIVP